MRGSPLLRALLAFAVLLGLGLPVWKLTHLKALARALDPPTASNIQDLVLELAFTSPPRTLRVSHLETDLVNAQDFGVELKRTLRMDFPKEGVDLHFQIVWNTAAPTAVKIVLIDSAGERHEKTRWATGELDDVLTFP
jgi:hypothetical protein